MIPTHILKGTLGLSLQTKHVTSLISRSYSFGTCKYFSTRSAGTIASNEQTRPILRLYPISPLFNETKFPSTAGRRSIFIQTQDTPNMNALKFLPNHPILPPNLPSSFIEYLNPKATLMPPYRSPLAAKILSNSDINSVFYGPDFITVTKFPDANWIHIKPEVFSLITEAVTSGTPIVNVTEQKAGVHHQSGDIVKDSLSYDEKDSEVVGMIKELLELRIRPAIQEDGGDIDFKGFKDGMVLLKLRGACRNCSSSTVTLKNGIEAMLSHYIEEVKGVRHVLDEEEEIAAREFARFELKLQEQKELEVQRMAVTSSTPKNLESC